MTGIESGVLVLAGVAAIFFALGNNQRYYAKQELKQAQEMSEQNEIERREWEKQKQQEKQEIENERKAISALHLKNLDDLHQKNLAEQEKYRREAQERENKIKEKIETLNRIYEELEKSHIQGRRWLAEMISAGMAAKYQDREDSLRYRSRSRPAYKAAEVVKQIKQDLRHTVKENAFLKSQLDTYREYFPFIVALEEDILNDSDDYRNIDSEEIQQIDPVRYYISSEEYNKLSSTERNQRALDGFLSNMSKLNVGRMYERQIGWYFEQKGYDVRYDGLIKGLEDRGRDLLVTDKRKNTLYVVQAKCWSQAKTIHEKHIFQLFGSAYEIRQQEPILTIKPIFITTTKLSSFAQEVARRLDIEIQTIPLRKDWPMIKCNLGKDGELIYHLPFDQLYDRTKIDKQGECWAKTVAEAEQKGFRRAWKWRGNS